MKKSIYTIKYIFALAFFIVISLCKTPRSLESNTSNKLVITPNQEHVSYEGRIQNNKTENAKEIYLLSLFIHLNFRVLLLKLF